MVVAVVVNGLMETRSYVVEQHFGSALVTIEVEIGFMETRLKQKNERKKRRLFEPKRTSPLSLTFFAKVVARQTKGKMIVDGIKGAMSLKCKQWISSGDLHTN